MNKLIYEYLNNKYPNDFDITYLHSREVRLFYNGNSFLIFNPRSSFIIYNIHILSEIKCWFGDKQYNDIRKIINGWLFNRYNTTNVNEFRNFIMNNKDSYKTLK